MASDMSEFNYMPRPVEMSEAVEFVVQGPAYHTCFRKSIISSKLLLDSPYLFHRSADY